jgi:hypothetical protein
MAKSKLIPIPLIHHSKERIKGVNTVLPPKLDPLDIEAILDRANKINGREYNIFYIEKILTGMYPRIASFGASIPQETPNPSPLKPVAEQVQPLAPKAPTELAPEVAPPPIIPEASTGADVTALENYRSRKLTSHNLVPSAGVQADGQLDEEALRDIRLREARDNVLTSYNNGDANRLRKAA